MQVYGIDKVVDLFLSLKSFGDSELKLLKKVNDTSLNQLIVLQIARVAVLEALKVDFGLVILLADIE